MRYAVYSSAYAYRLSLWTLPRFVLLGKIINGGTNARESSRQHKIQLTWRAFILSHYRLYSHGTVG